MYKEFFGLSHTPFTNEIPAKDLYLSPGLEETLGRLSYVAKNHLLCVITADVGCGKTTAVRRFSEMLNPEAYVVFYLSDSNPIFHNKTSKNPLYSKGLKGFFDFTCMAKC